MSSVYKLVYNILAPQFRNQLRFPLRLPGLRVGSHPQNFVLIEYCGLLDSVLNICLVSLPPLSKYISTYLGHLNQL